MADFPLFAFTTQEDWYWEIPFLNADAGGAPLPLVDANGVPRVFMVELTPAQQGGSLLQPVTTLTMGVANGITFKDSASTTLVFRVARSLALTFPRGDFTADILEVVSGERHLFMPVRIRYSEPSGILSFLSRLIGVTYSASRQPVVTPVAIAGRQGVRGNSVLNATRAPTPADGVDGDYWIEDRSATNGGRVMYGPKLNAAWPSIPWLIEAIATLLRFRFSVADGNAAAGQTLFRPGAYTPGTVQVFLCGVALSAGRDFVAINGSTVVLSNAVEASDTVEIIALNVAGVQMAAPIVHQHEIADVNGLGPALAAKTSDLAAAVAGLLGTADTDHNTLGKLATLVEANRASLGKILGGSLAEVDTFIEVYNRFVQDESVASALNTALTNLGSALATHSARTDNPHAVTKAQVGLGNVSNLAPADLPISTLTAQALAGKSTPADLAAAVTSLLGGADADHNTLAKLAALIEANRSTLSGILAGSSADVDTFVEVLNRFVQDESIAAAMNTAIGQRVQIANNGSDFADIPTTRANLGLRETVEAVAVTALNTLAPLTNAPNGVRLALYAFGLLNGSTAISPAYSLAGKQISWLATKQAGGVDLEPGDPVLVRYTY